MSVNTSSKDARALLALAPVIPVITIDRASDAVPLARALVRGGLRAIEITLRTDAAMDAAKTIIAEVPDAIVGLGTVLTPADLDRAKQIGAAFAVSPGCSPDLLRAAAAGDLPYVPGIQTASELMACVNAGFDVVKFFPAVPAGGIAALSSLAGPFPSVTYCPTGGIGETNAAEWLAHPKVIAVGGSWIAPPSAVNDGAWDAIESCANTASRLRSARP
ncbi:bifunctional 4-hydroxy-2-oxoglutarate aldolase/2-dehydro-3-deoxy-phosphogluconate aldolase [Undibacter mobilis]|uniref:2-dehydro-3-deoxy-phosphogluconate aldolase n=1 Tax=Undibacter mobilis TaxID=2292256 RepID=A0A371B6N4_9BRAD|nr:bifunctional 4-hydroxy-2-oxoglutarate aldolase/2-dehydro-3-deoxy-phosphogluconate aldolase [Undibacter mobilis]RDV03249.1 bifunctional 4-hydroxy-2-oxoglutarate aldolase/2-dehydro-3-deoxy-phosphogluconate aldolase [Undibacter mobilis]